MEFLDWINDDLASDIWHKKYQWNNESFDEWLDRVSGGNEDIKQLIVDKRFLFGGRILSNRGLQKKGKKVTYSNCYVLDAPKDNLESIFETASKLARTFSYGGGVGIDLGNLRPKGTPVNNTAKETTGAVSFMDLYSMTTGLIGQNGRRGALMLSMPITHPDIEEFIDVKTDLDRVTKANISVRITNEFMKAVRLNESYDLSFYDDANEQSITKTVNARDLFMKLCKNNWDYAEPGILYWDEINSNNLLSEYIKNYEFEYAGTNPCLHGDTIIKTTDGDFKISELVGKQVDVFAMDDDGKLCIKKATKIWKTKENAELVKVVHHRGELICTPDHRIYTLNRGWVEAKNLQPKDKLNGLGMSMKDEKHCCYKLTSDKKYHSAHRFILGHYEDIQGKDVHHVDDNPLNNVRCNLQALTHGQHSSITNVGHECYANRCEVTGRFIEGKTKQPQENLQVNKDVRGKNFIVKEVVKLDYTADVYDMTVPGVHNFVANDIIVHNCAEEPLPAGGSCLLGSINLSAHVTKGLDNSWYVNLPLLRDTVRKAVIALDEVLDEGLPLHPLEIQRQTVADWRQIGLGIMGFGDLLYKLEIAYGSEESIEIIDILGSTIKREALETSMLLAKEQGPFPKWNTDYVMNSNFLDDIADTDLLDDISEYGLRHSQLLTIAPTGTLSTMLGISGGVEPLFALQFWRKTETLHDEDRYYQVTVPVVQEMLGEWASSTVGTDEQVPLPDYMVTSHDISPIDRVKVQGAWQNYIDASISSTVNLKEDATVDDVFNIYMEAWGQGCKGITVYRDNCKRSGILMTSKDDEKTDEVITELLETEKRGYIVPHTDNSVGLIRRIVSSCGTLWVNCFFNRDTHEICDIFLSKGSKGGCQSYMIGLSRMISLVARAGVSNDIILDQLRSVPPCPSYMSGKITLKTVSKGTCCPSAIANAIEDMINEYNCMTFGVKDVEPEIIVENANVDLVEEYTGCKNGH